MTSPDAHSADHVQFLVKEKTPRTNDTSHSNSDDVDAPESLSNEHDALGLLSNEPRISPATFCRAFPFHVMFNRELRIIQTGFSIARVVPELQDRTFSFADIFSVVRPSVDVTFDGIVARANTVFVVRVRGRTATSSRAALGDEFPLGRCRCNSTSEDPEVIDGRQIRLKGEMIYVEETDNVLFLCSPCVTGLQDLSRSGLSLADVPIHDSTRDLFLLSEQFRAEYELTQRLQVSNCQFMCGYLIITACTDIAINIYTVHVTKTTQHMWVCGCDFFAVRPFLPSSTKYKTFFVVGSLPLVPST